MAPVVSAALGALGPLPVKLGGLLAGQYGRLKGVRREIRSLESELKSMHAALEEYTKLEDPSGQVKAWISLVRELAYDTEDILDKFIHHLGKGGRRGGFKEFWRKIALPLKTLGARRGIADQIDDLKDRIKQVKDLKDSYKYLIIIDDVWSAQAWKIINVAFPENNCSSRIIVTTRINDVAKSCCLGGDDQMYELKSLCDLHSRMLFMKRIFGPEKTCPDMLEEVSNDILKKCGGLPLAIISIAGLLANRPAIKEEWEKVKRSIGSAMEKTKSLEGMSSILSLSYNDLAPNLKTCLLYLSLFPEDHVIKRTRLVRLWIAEGFISVGRGQSKQEAAENYFYELINKSMVQPVDIGYDGQVQACRVHDMMLELIISKSVEGNFTTVVGGGQSLKNQQGFIRRLSIQYIDKELASALANLDLSHVRTLIVIPSCCIKNLPTLDQFEALRVLDFQGIGNLEDYDMNGLDKLVQLKYLNFLGTLMSKLPSGIVMLSNLETLVFGYTNDKKLPAGFGQLTKLEHLKGGRWIIPDGIGDMKNLQLISGFVITSNETDVLEDIGKLTNLKELKVDIRHANRRVDKVSFEDKRCEAAFLSSLCKLGTCKLQALDIKNTHDASLDLLDSWSPLRSSLQRFSTGYMDSFTNFPKWITPALTNLADLRICLNEMTEDGLVTLGQLPCLLRLELCPSNKFVGTVQRNYFPNLKVLGVKRFMKEQAYVSFVEGSVPKLEELSMSFSLSAAKANGFYSGIEHLSSLKQAKIWLGDKDATHSECKAAASAIRKEAGANPNHPALTLWGEPEGEDNKEIGPSIEVKSKGDADVHED